MIRSVSMAAILATAFAFPALAQEVKSPPAAAVQAVEPLKLTADQAKAWVDKQVYSSDNQKIGEIAAFARGTDNTVTEMHIDIGGFLGMGETRVRLMPAQFKLQGDRAVLNVTAEQAKSLPKVQK
jgi:lipopolysaccharide export system protein LptC